MSRTRIVHLLRILLPLAALVLLSTLFLFSGDKGDDSSLLPYAEVTPENIDQRPVIVAPTYAGVSRDGTEINMTATSADPGNETRPGTIETVNLTLSDPQGLRADLVAGAGVMDSTTIRLSDGVTMTTSTGWTMTSKAFLADVTEGRVSSTDQVDIHGPFGDLTAQAMELRRLSDGSHDHVLDFTGGVRMVYQP
ncbi:LPS export ABC transporter periplasmic protein LptC [Paracoccus sp. (in: a-proteobacteria)]|uniref:LPS export ABC transporter periplasmic protein LptC n=1 Tax=Paracoccus sp. TaxID=267 RepID=UPI002898E97E|nr:LPS export ABC transporter periplasmic protein LptC [Paracoccus sp. (in: a-proteobacteria)]